MQIPELPNFITKSQVLEIHKFLIENFGGCHGILNEGLLDSALAQPQATFFWRIFASNDRISGNSLPLSSN